jgi:hypothetical protein
VAKAGPRKIARQGRGRTRAERPARSSEAHEMNEPLFTQSTKALGMTCRVEVNILASTEIVWSLLTDAKGFPRWNSTVTRIDGDIRDGERLRLHVPGTSRTFTPKVSAVASARGMIWSDGISGVFKGVRTFQLRPRNAASIDFAMEEQFSGLVFGLTKRMFPDFRPIFEAYASDLKREAERIANEHAGRVMPNPSLQPARWGFASLRGRLSSNVRASSLFVIQ